MTICRAALTCHLRQLVLSQFSVGRHRAQRVVVRHQRVHAIDGRELLRQRIRRGVMIGRRSGNAGEQIVVVETGKEVLRIAEEAAPVGAHPGGRQAVRDNRGRPLDGVNLGDERGDDETRLLEEALVGPSWVALLESIAHRVVLERKETMHQAQAHPAVVGHAGDLETRDGIDQQPAIGADLDLAGLSGADGSLRRRRRAVHLGSIPPV